jgi:L-lactate dehydrogenase complex protein LldG
MNTQPISSKISFIQKVRTALGHSAGARRNFDDVFLGTHCEHSIVMKDGKHLLNRLIDESIPLNLKVIPVPTAADAALSIVDLTQNRTPEWSDTQSVVAWRHPLIDSMNLPERLKSRGIPVYVPGDGTADFELFRTQSQTALIGVTSADYCIVESASLVLKTRPGRPGMVSLLPSIHVAVITEDQLLESLGECYALVRPGPDTESEGMTCCLTMISGPSKTADIEAVMVHGAHGPREMIIYVISCS